MVNQAYLSAITANVICFMGGTSLSWSSPVLPKLNDTNIDNIPFGRRITSEESSWIASLLSLSAIFGPFIYGTFADKLGRKLSITLLGIPYLIGYTIMIFAKSVTLYYVGRIFIGLGVGGAFAVNPMYLGEIAEDSNRGALGTMMNIFASFGLFFSYFVGPYVSVTTFNTILAVIPIIFMISFFLLATESPHFYAAKGNYNSASKNLNKLRGTDKTDKELDDIKATIERSKQGSIFDLFKSKSLLKALIISVSLISLQQLSGINAILFYTQTIFDASGGDLAPEICSIIIGAVLFATSFVTPLLVDRLGRKALLYFSAIGMIISEVPLGVYFYLQSDGQDVDGISWLPVVSLVVYIITYNCGFSCLPLAVMGELFPNNVKSLASSLTSTSCCIFSFTLTKFFPSLADAIGMGPSFWLFAGFCVAAFIFTYFYVIETKGKSLQEIQDALES